MAHALGLGLALDLRSRSRTPFSSSSGCHRWPGWRRYLMAGWRSVALAGWGLGSGLGTWVVGGVGWRHDRGRGGAAVVDSRSWSRRPSPLVSHNVDRGYGGIRGTGRELGRDMVQGGVEGVED